MDAAFISVVPADSLHQRLGVAMPLELSTGPGSRPLSNWQAELDDDPILRYLYRHLRPQRHLELSGTSLRPCLEECSATVWAVEPPTGALAIVDNDRFRHRLWRSLRRAGDWNDSAYPQGFFDSAFVEGGPSRDSVLSDTLAALSLVKRGGFVVWHNFCPDPALFATHPSVAAVVDSISKNWIDIAARLQDAFWIRPSFVLVGRR